MGNEQAEGKKSLCKKGSFLNRCLYESALCTLQPCCSSVKLFSEFMCALHKSMTLDEAI